MSNSKSGDPVEERRYQIRKAFENGAPLQYRSVESISPADWRDATWCAWDWSRYSYRIKPKEKIIVEKPVSIYPYLVAGVVVWAAIPPQPGFKKIKKFRMINGIRHAIIEKEVE